MAGGAVRRDDTPSQGWSVTVEHRWGERSVINVPVRLDARPHALAFGRLRDASVSGAYIETAFELPLWTRISVELDWGRFQRDETRRVAAYVARRDAGGIGLEWCELAPRPIVSLIRRRAALLARSRAAEPIESLAALAGRAPFAFPAAV